MVQKLKRADFRESCTDISYTLACCKATPKVSAGRLQDEITLMMSLLRNMATERPHLLGHGDRTASYALWLGKACGLPPHDLIHLHYAALLHDIGQLTLPREVLEKDGPLTADEYALIQSHPRSGARLLEPISFLHIPALWIAHHHEYWDGSGYPYGLRGTFIPLGSRILAVADTFDAMTSSLADRPSLDSKLAFALLQVLAGSQLDPELVEAFLHWGHEPLARIVPEAGWPDMVDGRRAVPPASGGSAWFLQPPAL